MAQGLRWLSIPWQKASLATVRPIWIQSAKAGYMPAYFFLRKGSGIRTTETWPRVQTVLSLNGSGSYVLRHKNSTFITATFMFPWCEKCVCLCRVCECSPRPDSTLNCSLIRVKLPVGICWCMLMFCLIRLFPFFAWFICPVWSNQCFNLLY